MAIDLKLLREKRKMTQEELGTAIGVSKQAICSLEQGVNRPSVDTARKLGKVLKFDWKKLYED